MAYNLATLYEAVLSRLESTPMATLSDLSREFHAGERSIEKAVAEREGTPFRALRRRILLRKAYSFLEEPGRSVKEISFLLGFASPKSFARFIKRASGRSATEFRAARLQR